MKKIGLIWILVLGVCATASGQYKVFQDYTEKHSHIAVSEMHRTGIPASIKLAQGLLESNAGRSELATEANNHFGIKCGGDWNGNSFYKEDDDYEGGRLVKSCFRAFSSTEESYIAHSEFLRNPNKNSRYGFLFNLKSTDYQGWAHGLKKAGYATSPTYAQKLIKIIEDYELYTYDREVVPMDMPVIADIGAKGRGKSYKNVTLPKKSVFNNAARMVYAQADEKVTDLAARFMVSENRIYKYNERLTSPNQKLKYGERVYLSRKRNRYRGKQDVHYVQGDETMYDIAQLYGIKLTSLMGKNRMKVGEEPAEGTAISLKKRIRKSDKPMLRSDVPTILPEKPTETGPDPDHSGDPVSPEDMSTETEASIQNRMHEVVPGDTLYGLSRKYNVTVDSLRSLNQLEGNNIHVGQLLRVQ